MQELKINLLKKKDINQLLIFLKYQKTSLQLPLTIFRICIFGNIQNRIIEGERRKSASFENIPNFLNTSLSYQDQFEIYKNLILNIDFIKEIIFYKLWKFNKIDYFFFIRDFLNKSELSVFNEFIEKQKVHNVSSSQDMNNKKLVSNHDENKTKIENISKKFRHKLAETKFNNKLSNFDDFLEKLKLKSRSFRRNGFDFESKNDKKLDILAELYVSLTEIKTFLKEFLKSTQENGLHLKNQLEKDNKIFFNQFKNLYSGK